MGKKGGQAFDELTETIGAVFLPIMDEVVPALLPIIELLGELIKGLLPLLKPVIMIAVGGIKILIEVLMKVIGFLNDVVGAVKGVIDWVGKMVDIAANAKGAVEGALDQITPWSVSGAQGIPAIAELGARAFDAGPRSMLPAGGGTSVTVQVMSADPEQVVRAIRRWSVPTAERALHARPGPQHGIRGDAMAGKSNYLEGSSSTSCTARWRSRRRRRSTSRCTPPRRPTPAAAPRSRAAPMRGRPRPTTRRTGRRPRARRA